MSVRRVMPRPEIRDVVRSFGEQRIDFGSATATWTIPARPHQILDIYLAEPWKAQFDDGPLKTSPETVVVGPQSRLFMKPVISTRRILYATTGPIRNDIYKVGLNYHFNGPTVVAKY